MEWHMNDLSLNGQFPTAQALRLALEPILKTRHKHKNFQEQFFISKTLGERPATPTQTLRVVLQRFSDEMFRKNSMNWLDRSRFWEDAVSEHPDDTNYFEFETNDVTHEGLGESCRKQILGRTVSSVSFCNAPINCEKTPLTVQHGLTEEIFGYHDIQNIWDIENLEGSINASRPEPQNWDEFFEIIKDQFQGSIIFASDTIDDLRPRPFQLATKNKVIALLSILAEIAGERDASGAWSEKGQQLFTTFFTGEKAQFVPESDPQGNLWFNDPEDLSRKIQCTWHGRMSSMLGRMHFEWPIPPGQREVKVVYIGQKINKS